MKSVVLLAITLTLMSCTKERIQYVQDDKALNALADQVAELSHDREQQEALMQELNRKSKEASLFNTNRKNLTLNRALEGHTKIYPFKGKYKVLVIPVQFADAKFDDPDFFSKNPNGVSSAQDYIFGSGPGTMTTYYKHSSMGKLNLSGEVTNIVTVNGTLADYGEAVTGSSDKNAKGLVVAALKELMKTKTDKNWWLQYDSWDLSDYDRDKNFHEPDGFIDSVVLIYAGKSQASCQASFDPEGTRPPSADVPEGPRHDQAVECFNRIWPHRWSISLGKDDPDRSEKGPVVEGKQRGHMNGLKISDELFATDYNMQSEYSDRSTFIHEFGHSLSLPDVYSDGEGNSTGNWTVMSNNANLQAQEFGAFSKLSLGWLTPKVIKQGEETSLYLGASNFVSETQRENLQNFDGPLLSDDGESIVSKVPEFEENVYRSVVVLTEPTTEVYDIVAFPSHVGRRAAYSGTYDGEVRVYKRTFTVSESNPIVSFDTIYHIETATNFDSKDREIKVITDYDLGAITVNGKVQEELRIISGDANNDTLAEMNPKCEATRVLALRTKAIDSKLSDEEKAEFKEKRTLCQTPIWVNKKIDLSAFKGQEVEFEINLKTDAGYTEFGVVFDNLKIGDQVTTFESGEDTGDFKVLIDGQEETDFSQFYLMEYRDPTTKYSHDDKVLSLNMDNNISAGTQSMFLEEGDNLAEKFRMIKFDYQPGVLVWYFNSKMGDENDAVKNNGNGFLLVLNSSVEELKLPGILGKAELFDENGHYRDAEKDPIMKKFLDPMRNDFVCFSHIKYSTYLQGKAPTCENGYEDYMQGLTFEGKKLQFRRERFNELLPKDRYATVGVGKPYRNYTGVRTGLSTFSPEGTEDFSPFKVYKEVDGAMVLDEALTASAPKHKTVSSFSDDKNVHSKFKRFQGDSVLVEKKGFSFAVKKPSQRVLESYDNKESADANEQFLRRPRAKVYFNWKKLEN